MPVSRKDVFIYLLVQVLVVALVAVLPAITGTDSYLFAYVLEILALTWLLPEVRDWDSAVRGREKACRSLLWATCAVQIVVPIFLCDLITLDTHELNVLIASFAIAVSIMALLIVAVIGDYGESRHSSL